MINKKMLLKVLKQHDLKGKANNYYSLHLQSGYIYKQNFSH